MNGVVKILVVENHTPAAMTMVFLLTQAGFDVTAAHNGADGLELAFENKFDVIVLSVDLPDINGFKICRELKQRHISYRTPIIFVSKAYRPGGQAQAFEFGAADFIEGPICAGDFIERVYSQLEQANTRKDDLKAALNLTATMQM